MNKLLDRYAWLHIASQFIKTEHWYKRILEETLNLYQEIKLRGDN